MESVVLDSWAVMAWLKGQEPAAGLVREILERAERREVRLAMSIVNLGEVFYLSVKLRGLSYGERVLETLRGRLTTVSASNALVLKAAGLKGRYAIAYADGFAAATAMLRGVALVTGDGELRVMAEQEPELKLLWVGVQSPPRAMTP